jgi:hypothetical protein
MRGSVRPVIAVVGASALVSGAAADVSIRNDISGQYIEISQTGTNLLLHGEDEEVVFTTISNRVFPAGVVCVANNGGIAFNPTVEDLSPNNTRLPAQGAFGNSMALLAFWDDIGNKVGGVYYQDMGDRYIVEWFDRSWDDGTPERVRFQIQVFPDPPGPGNQVLAQFIYKKIDGNRAGGGSSATIGFQGGAGTGFNDSTWTFDGDGHGIVHNDDILSIVIPTPAPGAATVFIAGILAAGRRQR